MSDPLPPTPPSSPVPPTPPAEPPATDPVPAPAPVPPAPTPAPEPVPATPPPVASPAFTPLSEPAAAAVPPGSDRSWAVGIHLSGLLGLLACSIPAINIVGPLVIWLLKRPESAYLDAVGKRVLNFQISYAIYMAACWIGFFALSIIVIGFLFLPLVGIVAILWLIFTIMGAVKEGNGETYDFPFTIQFLK